MKSTVLLATLALAAASAWAANGDIKCGGVGSDERDKLEGYARDANLSLEMFISPGGEYVADVDVTMRPVGAGSEINVHTDGPICYLRVPAGRYRIEATFSGVTRSAQATVGAKVGKPARVAIAFPKSVGDRQNDAASPEEKAQAARRP